MTDREVLELLDDLERLLGNTLADPDPQAIGQWDEAFKTALRTAERGPRWPEVLARGKALGASLNRTVAGLQAAQRTIKHTLEQGGAGRRALSAYRTLQP